MYFVECECLPNWYLVCGFQISDGSTVRSLTSGEEIDICISGCCDIRSIIVYEICFCHLSYFLVSNPRIYAFKSDATAACVSPTRTTNLKLLPITSLIGFFNMNAVPTIPPTEVNAPWSSVGVSNHICWGGANRNKGAIRTRLLLMRNSATARSYIFVAS